MKVSLNNAFGCMNFHAVTGHGLRLGAQMEESIASGYVSWGNANEYTCRQLEKMFASFAYLQKTMKKHLYPIPLFEPQKKPLPPTRLVKAPFEPLFETLFPTPLLKLMFKPLSPRPLVKLHHNLVNKPLMLKRTLKVLEMRKILKLRMMKIRSSRMAPVSLDEDFDDYDSDKYIGSIKDPTIFSFYIQLAIPFPLLSYVPPEQLHESLMLFPNI